ncbi:hypothetical protein SDC9_208945 [bioreactor metagenome]|uniref:Uncharacterized protein n=1 Tax=bioreactor metagenome TaxID=1076179 RepID=A0A645JC29_9ZZZZ
MSQFGVTLCAFDRRFNIFLRILYILALGINLKEDMLHKMP